MCGACGSNARVSVSTAELNRERAKPLVAASLNRALGRSGGTVRHTGDRWTWQRPTGAAEVFADVEDLVRHLLQHGAITAQDFDDAVLRRIVARASGT